MIFTVERDGLLFSWTITLGVASDSFAETDREKKNAAKQEKALKISRKIQFEM